VRRYLFVDGTNFYAGQYELFGPKRYIVFSDFIEQLESALNRKFDKVFFYCSYSPRSLHPSKKELSYLKNEYFFYRSVKKTPRVVFYRGYRSKKSGKEKGVDVKIASDLVSLSLSHKYHEGYLLTGDADFLEALFVSDKFSKGVKHYIVCLENKIMYRGSYYFPTFIVRLTGKKLSIKEKYYRIVNMDSELIVENVSK